MANNNESFKRALREEDGLPQSMSWENVEQGIISKMENKREKSNLIKARYATYSIALLCIITTVLGIWYYSSKSHSAVNAENNSIMQNTNSNIIAEKTEETNSSNNNLDENITIQKEDLILDHGINNSSNDKTKIYTLKENKLYNSSGNTEQVHNIIRKEQFQNDHNNGTDGAVYSSDNNRTQLPTETQFTPNTSIPNVNQFSKTNREDISPILSTDKSTQSNTIENVQYLAGLGFYAFKISKDRLDNMKAFYDNQLGIKPVRKASNIAVILSSGINNSVPNFSGSDLAEVKNSTERGIISYQGGLHLQYNINPSWKLTAGLSYQSLETNFDYYNEKDVVVDAEAKIVDLNAINLDTLQISYTTVPTNAVAWESIQHYNKTTMLSIPIMLSRNWNLSNKFQFDTGLGMQYNFGSSSNGKAIISDQGETSTYLVQEYNSSFYNTNSSFHLLASTGINYSISDRVFVGTALQGSYGLSNLSSSSEYNYKLSNIQGNIRLGFRL